MTNYNTMCFYRSNVPGKRDAKCLCKKCRELRSKTKVDPSQVLKKRIERAIKIIKDRRE